VPAASTPDVTRKIIKDTPIRFDKKIYANASRGFMIMGINKVLQNKCGCTPKIKIVPINFIM
jgi:hypothetical protein